MKIANDTVVFETNPPRERIERPIRRQREPNRREFLALAYALVAGLVERGVDYFVLSGEGAVKELSDQVEIQPEQEMPARVVHADRCAWSFQLDVFHGIEMHLVGYEGREAEDGSSWNRYLTDKDGRLLYCDGDIERSNMLKVGRLGGTRLTELRFDENEWASVPLALDELHKGLGVSDCPELFYLINALTDIVPSCGYVWNEGLCGFLMECWLRLFERSDSTWDDVISSRGYKELTVEEGIQLAIGIVLSSACRHDADTSMHPAEEDVSTMETNPHGPTCGMEDPTVETKSPYRPICYCLEVSLGFKLYFLCYQACDEFTWAPVLTDKDGRLLYCSEPEAVGRMLHEGREDLALHGEPDLEEMEYVSVPDALKEYRDGIRLGQCWILSELFDALSNLIPSAGYVYDDGLNAFLAAGFVNLFGGERLPWEELIRDRGYKGLSVEEGIQLALGIVLTKGRIVA